MVYAIVRAGGHQEKVSVGDIITVNRMKAAAGDTVELAAVLHVDGDTRYEQFVCAPAEAGFVYRNPC